MIRALQQEFPIVEHPFRLIAGSIGLDEETVLQTVREWVGNGTIRRFGARLSHRRLGFRLNVLTAWNGPEVEQWGRKFAESTAVSHCYIRQAYPYWPYTLYAMVHARSEHELRRIMASMLRTAPGASMVRLKTLYELKKSTMRYFVEE
jgi:DNA-binding Lrp family transcriptional regulator